MKDFASAQEMFEHLSTYISDQHAVLVAVRRQFSTFRLPLSRAAVRPEDPGMNPIHQDALAARSAADSSKALLHAIHKAHPAIMNTLAAQGRTVVYP